MTDETVGYRRFSATAPGDFLDEVTAEIPKGKPSDAQILHTVNRLVIVDITREIAGQAGAVRERAQGVRAKKRDLTVGAIVATVARTHAPALILTGNVGD